MTITTWLIIHYTLYSVSQPRTTCSRLQTIVLCRETNLPLNRICWKISCFLSVWMVENVYMAYNNFHTKTCVFTQGVHVGSHEMKLPKTFKPLKYATPSPPKKVQLYTVVRRRYLHTEKTHTVFLEVYTSHSTKRKAPNGTFCKTQEEQNCTTSCRERSWRELNLWSKERRRREKKKNCCVRRFASPDFD